MLEILINETIKGSQESFYSMEHHDKLWELNSLS